jgi:biopolymer transport protein ExbD
VTTVAAVTITKDRRLYFNSEPVDEAALVAKLHAAKASSAEVNLVISADKDVPHGLVVHMIDLAKIENISKFAINVERSE